MNELNLRGRLNFVAHRCVHGGATVLGWWVWGVCAFAFGQAPATTTHATHVMVLRSSGSEVSASVDAIDAALLHGLSSIAGIDNAELSPVQYEEVQLAVGCDDQSRECLAAIADTARVTGLFVRSLRRVGAGLQLDVVYFDASSRDAPAQASESGDAQHILASIPSVVRRLFGLPDVPVAVAAEVPAERTLSKPAWSQAARSNPAASNKRATEPVGDDGMHVLTAASIVTLAAGAGALALGVVLGASASADFDDYRGMEVTDPESARRASATFDDANAKATVANVLMPTGGVLLVGGVVMLAVGLSDSEAEPAATHVSFLPSRTGGAVMVSGAL